MENRIVEIFRAIEKTDFKIEVQGISSKNVYAIKNHLMTWTQWGIKKQFFCLSKTKIIIQLRSRSIQHDDLHCASFTNLTL